MSVSAVSATGIYNASQSPLQSLSQHKHRKNASVSDVEMQNPSASPPAAASGQPGSKINVTA